MWKLIKEALDEVLEGQEEEAVIFIADKRSWREERRAFEELQRLFRSHRRFLFSVWGSVSIAKWYFHADEGLVGASLHSGFTGIWLKIQYVDKLLCPPELSALKEVVEEDAIRLGKPMLPVKVIDADLHHLKEFFKNSVKEVLP